MSDYYVYAHLKLSDGAPFYIGKGKGRRAYTKTGRNSKWKRVSEKYGYRVVILHTGLSEREAFEIERAEIAKCRPECNFTEGGDGISGYRHTSETKAALRAAHIGRKQSPELIAQRTEKLRGKKRSNAFCEQRGDISKRHRHSEETRAKMRTARMGRKQTPEAIAKTAAFHRGSKRSEESRRRMSAAQAKRKVARLDTGEVYESITAAAEWLRANGWPKATKTGVWLSIERAGTAYGCRWGYAS